MLALAVLSGIGIAAYHPEGARRVAHASGRERATAMSYFGIGGSLGFAAGPAIATAALLAWGLDGTLVFFGPVLFGGALIAAQFSAIAAPGIPSAAGQTLGAPIDPPDAWGPFGRLTVALISRAILFYTLNTFVPLYWINVLQQSEQAGGMALTLLLAAGILGNLLGGRLSDRFGCCKVMCAGYALLIPILPAFLWTDRPWIAQAFLLPAGFLTSLTFSPTVVLGQQYLPGRVGLASGVTLGLAVAIGGMASPLFGWIADLHGIRGALAWMTPLPVVSLAFALTLPEPKRAG
jgi:FSR family fosmidomycin resistance protein-like MFS transporter